MATDFFERQARARKNTIWLVVLFLIAVVGIVGSTFALTFAGLEALEDQSPDQYGNQYRNQSAIDSTGMATSVALAALAMIILGTLYKVVSLRAGGGRSVAESVGGRQLNPNSTQLEERQLLNVVEEMAIASGMPVPPVYLLEEDSINAFASGYSPSDAVVGVTRGAIRQLNREQLQGVIAHEFSHILNGDMRMNIRLIGILHGILLLTLIGKMLLRMLYFSGGGRRRSSGKGDGGAQIIMLMVAVGLALIVLGFLGSLMGGLIKAAVSRQREYLADASAVQFTRNPNGIGGALKRLGAGSSASIIQHPGAPVASHMYFGKGVFEGFTGLMATHPPLEKRILAIEPAWNGVFPEVDGINPTIARETAAGQAGVSSGLAPSELAPPKLAPRELASAAPAVTAPEGAPTDEVLVGQVIDAVDHIGDPEQLHQEYAARLLAAIDPVLIDASHEPYTARALVFALLLDEDPSIRARQISGLSESIEPHVVDAARKLYKRTVSLDQRARLPLLDMTLPALCSMSPPQYTSFMKSFSLLADADERHSLFEWVLAQILIRHLRPHYVSVRSPVTLYYSMNGLAEPISVLLSTMARVGHSEEWVDPSFQAAKASLPNLNIALLPASQCTLRNLAGALKKLTRATARMRGRLIDASVAAICADNHVDVKEAELLRGIADLLDCPVPPLVPKVAEA